MMVDFHSHILPGMDDGSSSVEESVEMLKALAGQGVDKVIATPHFYANDESVSCFIKRREKSFESLKAYVTDEMPQILLGAEVKYYEGISRNAELKELCIENTDLLLLEMPSKKWTEYVIRELIGISGNGNIRLVLAHIDRYVASQKADVISEFVDNGILLQINADFAHGILTKKKIFSLLRHQAVQFLGSDCHNMTDRAPDISNACKSIRKKFGDDFTDSFTSYGKNFLK